MITSIINQVIINLILVVQFPWYEISVYETGTSWSKWQYHCCCIYYVSKDGYDDQLNSTWCSISVGEKKILEVPKYFMYHINSQYWKMKLFGNIIFQYCDTTIFDTLGQIINVSFLRKNKRISKDRSYFFLQLKKEFCPNVFNKGEKRINNDGDKRRQG